MCLDRLGTILAVFFVLTGCVYVNQPIGDEAVRLDADEWNGTWLAGRDEALTVAVRDAEAGLLEIAWVDCSKACKLETVTVEIRQSGELLFLNGFDVETRKWKFARIAKEPDQLILWDPNREKFMDLLKSGQLPGENRQFFTDLGDLTRAQRALVEGEELFNYQSPLVLLRWSDH